MNHLILHLSTLSTVPNSMVAHICMGLVDTTTGNVDYIINKAINVEGYDPEMFCMDKRTLDWWATQPSDVQDIVFNKDAGELSAILKEVADKTPFNSLVWCNTSFDAPIVNNLFKTNNVFLPWKFDSYRDFNTIYHLTNVTQPIKTYNPTIDVDNKGKYLAAMLEIIQQHKN